MYETWYRNKIVPKRCIRNDISDNNISDIDISDIDISDIAQQDLVALARSSVFTSQFFSTKKYQKRAKDETNFNNSFLNYHNASGEKSSKVVVKVN